MENLRSLTIVFSLESLEVLSLSILRTTSVGDSLARCGLLSRTPHDFPIAPQISQFPFLVIGSGIVTLAVA